jgi:HK97 family phage portal protein
MNFFDRIVYRLAEWRATAGGSFHVSQTPPGWVERGWGWASEAGITVTPEMALNVSTVYACVRVLSEGESSLPLLTYRRLDAKRKERATDVGLYSVLHSLPNPEMTSIELRDTLMGHVLTWGNCYAEIEFSRGGEVRALWPLRPDRMTPRREGRALVFDYQLTQPDSQGRMSRTFAADMIFRVHGLGFDGIQGYSPVRMARDAIGLAMATDRLGAKFFSNGARPGGVLQHPGKLGEQAYKRLKESWEARHQGLENAARVAILEEGITYKEVGMPMEDAQFLQTRRFQVEEIARWYRVPPHMVGDLERATFSNIEHMNIEFVSYSLAPWLIRWEQAISRDLLTPTERQTLYVEHLVDGLLRGDIQSRYAAYNVGRQNGWLSADDIRALENMNPLPEGQGEIYLVPLNMVPASQVGMDFSQTESGTRQEAGSQAETRAIAETSDDFFDGERRAAGAVLLRHRLQGAWFGTYQDVAARTLKREVQDVGAAARRFLAQKDYGSFSLWLEQFYREHIAFVIKQFTPISQSYGELVAGAVADEIGQEFWDDPQTREWIVSYLETFAARHCGISAARVRAAARAAIDAGEELLPAVEGELETWPEARAVDTARWESVRYNNALAVGIYLIAGRQKLRWQTFGENCPYCSALNGKIIGISSYFVEAGDYQPDGAERPLNFTSSYHHPPIHDGCDCMVSSV